MASLLRRRLEALLAGQPGSAELARALDDVEALHRRASRDRQALGHALALVADLFRRGDWKRTPGGVGSLPARGAVPGPSGAAPVPPTGPAAASGSPAALRAEGSPVARYAVGLFQEAPFAALLCDAHLTVLSINAAAEALFGFPPAEAEGK